MTSTCRFVVMSYAAILLFACDTTDDEPGSCVVDDSGYRDGRWTEPVGEAPAAGGSTRQVPDHGFSVGFRWDAPAHVTSATAWLDEQEPIDLDVDIVAAQNIPPTEAAVALFVDGKQVEVAAGSTKPHLMPAQIQAGQQTTVHVHADPSQIPVGASSLAVTVLRVSDGYLIDGFLYTALKGGAFDFQPRQSSQGTVERARASGAAASSNAAGQLRSSTLLPTPPDGRIDLSISMQPANPNACTTGTIPVLAVALLDLEQVELPSCGLHCRAELSAGQSFRVETSLAVPKDQKAHTITVLQFQGDGRFSEVPYGEQAPWKTAFVKLLGFGSFSSSP